MGNALVAARLDTEVARLLSEQQELSGVSLRELSRMSGVKLTRLGDILKRGRAATAGEIERIAEALGGDGWKVLFAAQTGCPYVDADAALAERHVAVGECQASASGMMPRLSAMTVKAFEPQAFERAVTDVLRAEMGRQGISRRTLAEWSGISKSRVFRLLADGGPLSPVTVTVLESLCNALGVSMSQVFAEAEFRLAEEKTDAVSPCALSEE